VGALTACQSAFGAYSQRTNDRNQGMRVLRRKHLPEVSDTCSCLKNQIGIGVGRERSIVDRARYVVRGVASATVILAVANPKSAPIIIEIGTAISALSGENESRACWFSRAGVWTM
jgi:hypothetical protein